MKTENQVTIDFQSLGGPVHSGRSKGELVREKFKLDHIDNEPVRVVVQIPEATYSVTTSFFLGLFGDSVRKAGSREAFLRKFNFQAPEVFDKTFDTCISRALQEQRALVGKTSKPS